MQQVGCGTYTSSIGMMCPHAKAKAYISKIIAFFMVHMNLIQATWGLVMFYYFMNSDM